MTILNQQTLTQLDDSRFTSVYTAILTSLLDRGVRSTFTDLDRYGPLPLERKSS